MSNLFFTNLVPFNRGKRGVLTQKLELRYVVGEDVELKMKCVLPFRSKLRIRYSVHPPGPGL